jgi:4-amino-4-deoxy-L-arabinose transferase-like glycosyltransferase
LTDSPEIWHDAAESRPGRMPAMSFSSGRLTLPAWPTALVPGLRLLWTRTLFPGSAVVDDRLRLSSLALLILLPAVLLYPRLDFRLLEPDEGRYAEIGREMLLRGDWVVPHLQGEPYLDKPPLLYWLVVASYKVFGVYDWAARLVPALAVHGTILLCYLFGRRLLGESAAFRGALLLSVAPGLAGMGRLLTLDALLTFWVTLGLFAGERGRRMLCAIACGLGVLTKGPVAIVLAVVPLIAHHWLMTGRLDWCWKPTAVFASIIVVINAPWYLAVSIARPEFGIYFFVKHNLQRFIAPFDHLEPVWYYAPILLWGLLPATLFGWRTTRWLLSGDLETARTRTPDLGFCLFASGWCVLFFSLSGSKLPTYIMPAFGPLALAFGYYWSLTPGRVAAWIFGFWAASLFVVHTFALPWYAELRSPMGGPQAELRRLCSDPSTVVCCFPRGCDSASFYLRRDDLRPTRSKFVHLLIADLRTRDRTVILFTHNHSLQGLKDALPPDLGIAYEVTFHRTIAGSGRLTQLIGETPWGLCDAAVVERRR